MKFTTLAIFSAFFLAILQSSFAVVNPSRFDTLQEAVAKTNLLNNDRVREAYEAAIKKVREEFPTCKANVCFALDGSKSLNDLEYTYQLEFVSLVIAVLGADPENQFAAVEYGAIVQPIVELDVPNPTTLVDVFFKESAQAPLTFIAPGVQWCVSQFKKSPNAVNKIVVLGDGNSSFGDISRSGRHSRFGAVAIAKKFLRKSIGNDICAGIIGRGQANVNGKYFLEMVQNRRSHVLAVPNWDEIIDIIYDLIVDVCE